MVETFHGFGAVAGHGDVHPSLCIVPGNSEAEVSCAVPFLGGLIVHIQCF